MKKEWLEKQQLLCDHKEKTKKNREYQPHSIKTTKPVPALPTFVILSTGKKYRETHEDVVQVKQWSTVLNDASP